MDNNNVQITYLQDKNSSYIHKELFEISKILENLRLRVIKLDFYKNDTLK